MSPGANNKERDWDPVFAPAWWLPGGHSQTLWRKFSRAPKLEHVRQRLELKDGDFLDVDWALEAGHGDEASSTIAFILHGLCGCSRSSYVLAMQEMLVTHGVSSVAVNFRGCSGETNRLARAYHSGVSEDVEEAFQQLSNSLPDRDFVCIGSSLGANVLLKWLGERGERSGVRAAVAVSTPFDLAACSRSMEHGLSRIYGRYFTSRLVQDFSRKRAHFEHTGNFDQAELLQAFGNLGDVNSIWEFDDRVTAPLHGFESAEDYYDKCSSSRYLSNIATPTLLIQSRDDPLIPAAVIPRAQALPDNIELQETPGGGHVGFIAGAPGRWLERRILSVVQG